MTESTTPQLTEREVEEIEARSWVESFGDDRIAAPVETRKVLVSVRERDALVRDWRALRAEIADYERTDLVPRTRYNVADAEAREAREMVKSVAGKARIEIERLETENAALREQLAATQSCLLLQGWIVRWAVAICGCYERGSRSFGVGSYVVEQVKTLRLGCLHCSVCIAVCGADRVENVVKGRNAMAETRNYVADLDPFDSGLMPFTITFLGDDEDEPWEIDCAEVNDTHGTLDELLFWNLIIGARFITEDLRRQINEEWNGNHE